MREESDRTWGERHGGTVLASVSAVLLTLVLVFQSSC
jgi:hypothetical protein